MPTRNVWLSVFGMFAVRLKSFNALEEELHRSKHWECFVGQAKPSADTLGYALKRFSLSSVRNLLREVNRQSWRSKSVHGRLGQTYRVVAIDGHELSSSRARCCDQCLEREREVGGETFTEYYHRVVVAQWVGVTPPGILDLELVRPGEGEVVAARRLLERVLEDYARLVDVVSADALYLEAPFIGQILDAGKHVVVVMKQEDRDLYKDADRLRALEEPEVVEEDGSQSRVWDLEGLNTFSTLGKPVRVVWAEERKEEAYYLGGEPKTREVTSKWIWVTDFPSSLVSARQIRRWGHDRWDLENRGFNELVHLWGMNHVFVHHPVAIEAILLTLAVAFLTTYLFFERDLKPGARQRLCRGALARRLLESFCQLAGSTVWSGPRPPGG